MSPILGPYTLRHAFGDLVDAVFSPLSYIDDTFTKYSFKVIEKVQDRSDLSVLEEELYSSFDPYQYIRDSYIQNRKYKIGDGLMNDDLEDDFIDFDDF
jgi:phospholipid-binding lipoprotein MlaA